MNTEDGRLGRALLGQFILIYVRSKATGSSSVVAKYVAKLFPDILSPNLSASTSVSLNSTSTLASSMPFSAQQQMGSSSHFAQTLLTFPIMPLTFRPRVTTSSATRTVCPVTRSVTVDLSLIDTERNDVRSGRA